MIKFRAYWDTLAPDDLFSRFPTTNIQLVLGCAWRLMALDLDGPEAQAWFAGKSFGRRLPVTWRTNSGDSGSHVWFRLPEEIIALSKAILWRKQEAHTLVERLADRSLLLVPPSIHPRTGRRYQFASKHESPFGLGLPALVPEWILRLRPVITRTALAPLPMPSRARYYGERREGAEHLDRDRVLASIPDPVGLVRSWGVRITGRRSGGGWEAHAIGREDRHPSAVVYDEGAYWDPWRADGRAISLFDLGVELGIFSSWREALKHLGAIYAAP
jgi:hypothetical protein